MKTARTMIAVTMALFLQIALTPYVFAQMGGGGGMMGPGYGQGMGGGMMGGQGYGPGYGRNQGYGPYGPGSGYGPNPQQNQPQQNLTPEEQKAREKTFVEQYIQRYLPEYKLEKKK